MNGQLTELLKEIKSWSAQLHDQRHKENLTKFDTIFTKLDTLIQLKTDVQWLTWGVRGTYLVIIGVLLRWALN